MRLGKLKSLKDKFIARAEKPETKVEKKEEIKKTKKK
jgi:hypothetical protein